MDIEGAGGVVTAGLVGAAIEKPTGKAGEDHTGVCADCGSETSGNFCSNCGQPTHVHRSLLHLGEEVLHGVMHFDARIWRTLPLLILNPGKLTREWIHGKRTRYVSPLALFLFTVFVTFFALSFVHMPESSYHPVSTVAGEEGAAEFEKGRQEIAAARAQATTASDKAALDVADGIMAGVAGKAAEADAAHSEDGEAGGWQGSVSEIANDVYTDPNTSPGVKKVAKKLMNPDLAVYKIQQTFYKFAFLLVPLSIPFMALLFLWRRKTTLYDHGVFVLYSLTFVVMAGLVAIGLGFIHPALGALAWFAVILGLPVHQFAQLKGGYELGWFSTIWRFVLLQNFCWIIVGLFITAIIYLAVGV
jgi:hypothetical protein